MRAERAYNRSAVCSSVCYAAQLRFRTRTTGVYVAYDIPYVVGRQAAGLVAGRGEDPTVLGRRSAGGGCFLLRLQRGEKLGMPHSRPMSTIGSRCHELRIVDAGKTWRVIYRTDADAVMIADVFQKTTPQTPARVIADSRRRLRLYDLSGDGED